MALASNSTVTVDTVRAEMKRQLTPNEKLNYRGITKAAIDRAKLFGINTAKELIAAEHYDRQARPSDDPENLYIFSVGHGLTARLNMEHQQNYLRDETDEDVAFRDAYAPNRITVEEMHNRYLSMERPSALDDQRFLEELLHQVAVDAVSWWKQADCRLSDS
ncbi:hypothetical protein E4T39_07349 [Aureobasidium subglaciale]|nr:hypothetical protein E4T39_07349 [Aureobasidium subglaciale]